MLNPDFSLRLQGGSHDQSHLLPLKAGVSLMALGALAADPSLKLKVVPVGLSYFHAHKFRSRAVIEFGTPLEVDPALVSQFSMGGKDKREACGTLLSEIYDGLKSVTMSTPDWETMLVCLFLFPFCPLQTLLTDRDGDVGHSSCPKAIPSRKNPYPRPNDRAQQTVH